MSEVTNSMSKRQRRKCDKLCIAYNFLVGHPLCDQGILDRAAARFCQNIRSIDTIDRAIIEFKTIISECKALIRDYQYHESLRNEDDDFFIEDNGLEKTSDCMRGA
jgi:hypothetical protein